MVTNKQLYDLYDSGKRLTFLKFYKRLTKTQKLQFFRYLNKRGIARFEIQSIQEYLYLRG